jgi:hypothetical protein
VPTLPDAPDNAATGRALRPLADAGRLLAPDGCRAQRARLFSFQGIGTWLAWW